MLPFLQSFYKYPLNLPGAKHILGTRDTVCWAWRGRPPGSGLLYCSLTFFTPLLLARTRSCFLPGHLFLSPPQPLRGSHSIIITCPPEAPVPGTQKVVFSEFVAWTDFLALGFTPASSPPYPSLYDGLILFISFPSVKDDCKYRCK